MKKLPPVRKRIEAEMDNSMKDFENSFHKAIKGQSYMQNLPAKGYTEVVYSVLVLTKIETS